MKRKIDYTLYLCTDRDLMSTETIEEAVELAIKGGCTVVQLREKNCSFLEFYQLALRIKEITDKYDVPLIINDRVDLALAVDAAGVHVGQNDLPAAVIRRIIGKEKILGVSVSSLQQAIKARNDGADYLGVGAMYSTATKEDAQIVTISQLQEIRKAVDLPIVVIGGINKKTINNFRGYGINGVAVVSAVLAQKDVTAAAKELVTMFRE